VVLTKARQVVSILGTITLAIQKNQLDNFEGAPPPLDKSVKWRFGSLGSTAGQTVIWYITSSMSSVNTSIVI